MRNRPNSIFMLIPKALEFFSIDQFHSIILSNFIIKDITIILVDRLGSTVSYNQFEFFCGRHIEDCVPLASSYINSLVRDLVDVMFPRRLILERLSIP